MLKLTITTLLLLTPFQTPTMSDLSWIAGAWQTAPGGRRQIEEHWTTAAGGSMMGVSRTIAGDKTVEFEYLRIEQRADGIFYVAHPKARCPGTDRKSTRLNSSHSQISYVVFFL